MGTATVPQRASQRCAHAYTERMPTVSFTPALARFLAAPRRTVAGATVKDVLAEVFADRPALRGYVLDDQGAVRRHVAVYVNGRPIADRALLSDPVGPQDEVAVFQALSGG
jgi:molybdopterin synthase sulfur carrier subunit